MKVLNKRRTQMRVVRSLHLPIALNRKIVQAAQLTGDNVVEFIRKAAEAMADQEIAKVA